ncbi:MAG TPA: transposase, partial [Actinomycetes bacterium]|nr:transposase [Actinomycetes bacterium]
MTSARRCYPTDLTDAEWQLLALLIPAPKPGGRPPIHDRRELVNAMGYWVRAGCAWRLLPHDLPPWQTETFKFSTDPALVSGLLGGTSYYVNVHTTECPDGAVRGQVVLGPHPGHGAVADPQFG